MGVLKSNFSTLITYCTHSTGIAWRDFVRPVNSETICLDLIERAIVLVYAATDYLYCCECCNVTMNISPVTKKRVPKMSIRGGSLPDSYKQRIGAQPIMEQLEDITKVSDTGIFISHNNTRLDDVAGGVGRGRGKGRGDGIYSPARKNPGRGRKSTSKVEQKEKSNEQTARDVINIYMENLATTVDIDVNFHNVDDTLHCSDTFGDQVTHLEKQCEGGLKEIDMNGVDYDGEVDSVFPAKDTHMDKEGEGGMEEVDTNAVDYDGEADSVFPAEDTQADKEVAGGLEDVDTNAEAEGSERKIVEYDNEAGGVCPAKTRVRMRRTSL